MPHFKDGSEAKVGDRLRFKTGRYVESQWVDVMREAVIFSITPDSTSCNAVVAYISVEEQNGVRFLRTDTSHVTLGDCERAEVPIPKVTTPPAEA